MSGSVRGVAREGDSYRDRLMEAGWWKDRTPVRDRTGSTAAELRTEFVISLRFGDRAL